MRKCFACFLRKYTYWLPLFDLRASFVSILNTKRQLNEKSLVDRLPVRRRPSWHWQRRPKQNIEWPSWYFPSFQHPIHQWSTSIDSHDLNNKMRINEQLILYNLNRLILRMNWATVQSNFAFSISSQLRQRCQKKMYRFVCIVILTTKHIRIGIVRYSIKMWSHFSTFLSTIHHHNLHCIDRKTLERIDYNAKQTRICLQRISS